MRAVPKISHQWNQMRTHAYPLQGVGGEGGITQNKSTVRYGCSASHCSIRCASASLSRNVAAGITPSTWSGLPRADNRRSDRRIPQRPRDRHHTRLQHRAACRSPAAPRPTQISAQLRRIEIRAPFAPVIVRQILRSLRRHLAGQQPGHHRRVIDHADVVFPAEGKNLLLDGPAQQRIWRLQTK